MPSKPEEQPTSILTTGTFKFYEVTEHGITFRPATPQNIWLDTVKSLLGMHEGAILTSERTLMLLADALNYGEKEWPHEFAQAIDGTRQALGLSPKTIANAQWVYGKIESSRRRDGLTLGHMSVIAGLDDIAAQDQYMDAVIEHHLTVSDLKFNVAEKFPKTKRGKDRKKKAKPDIIEAGKDTAMTILIKLIDANLWFEVNGPTEKMKGELEKLYKTYRRKWASGRAKK